MAEITDAGLRLALYARVSTEEQREGQTIDSQVSELERFTREKEWVVTGIYKDAGWSGGIMERPELDHLRDDAQKGLFDAVLVNDVDRLARDVAHLGVIKRDLERKGIRVIFRKLPAEASPTYNLMVNILGSFAEFERELISDRTRRGRRHKVEVRKQYLGSLTSYGYSYTPKDRVAGTEGVLQIVPEEAARVQQMFHWVDVEGLSARRVKLRLDELKIRPRMGGSTWGKSSVLRVLKNEMYAGIWYYNKHQGCEPVNPTSVLRYRRRSKSSVRVRPRSEWLPIELPEPLRLVTRDQWQRVQQQLARNLAFSPRNEKHKYLLKGLVRCGGCGARYIGDPWHGRYFYRCIARCKKMPSVGEPKLNAAVQKAVADVLTNPAVILDPLKELDRVSATKAKGHLDCAEDIERQAGRLAAEERRVLDAYRSGIITPTQLATQLERVTAARAALELRRLETACSSEIAPAEVAKAATDYCTDAARNLSGFTVADWQELLRTIVHAIVFFGDRIIIQGKIPVPTAASAPELRIEGPVP